MFEHPVHMTTWPLDFCVHPTGGTWRSGRGHGVLGGRGGRFGVRTPCLRSDVVLERLGACYLLAGELHG